MDAKLEEYRARKRRRATVEGLKNRLLSMIPFQAPAAAAADHVIVVAEAADEASATSKPPTSKAPKPVESEDDGPDDTVLPFTDSEDEDATARRQQLAPKAPRDLLTYITWLAYFLLWATCWAIAIELQFGLVYLLMSAIAGVYLNTRTGPKRAREVSAYSVFNRDCKAIDGTLNAEQFEREIRYGPAGVR